MSGWKKNKNKKEAKKENQLNNNNNKTLCQIFNYPGHDF